jgi:hypothetical protein
LTRDLQTGQREAYRPTRLGFVGMRNAKPVRAERNLGKQNWAERDKVWINVKPNSTRCEEARKSGTLLRRRWAGLTKSTEFSEAGVRLTRFKDTREGELNPEYLN